MESVLERQLFTRYINHKFAVNTQIGREVNCESTNNLHMDKERLKKWANSWHSNCNQRKYEVMVFGRKNRKVQYCLTEENTSVKRDLDVLVYEI